MERKEYLANLFDEFFGIVPIHKCETAELEDIRSSLVELGPDEYLARITIVLDRMYGEIPGAISGAYALAGHAAITTKLMERSGELVPTTSEYFLSEMASIIDHAYDHSTIEALSSRIQEELNVAGVFARAVWGRSADRAVSRMDPL